MFPVWSPGSTSTGVAVCDDMASGYHFSPKRLPGVVSRNRTAYAPGDSPPAS